MKGKKRNKELIEEEINYKLELELMQEELRDDKGFNEKEKSFDNFDESELEEADLISRTAVEKLVDEATEFDDTETINPKVTDPVCDFENDTEYFEPEQEDDNNLLYGSAAMGSLNTYEEDSIARAELLEKDDGVKKPFGTNKAFKYYMIGAFSIIFFLLLVTFALVVYINLIKSKDNQASDVGATANGQSLYDESYVQSLVEENKKLNDEVVVLKNDLAELASNSSAQSQDAEEIPPAQEPEPEPEPEPVQEPEPTPEPEPEKPKTYIVKKGDTLQKISQQVYGNVSSYKKIAEANNIKNDVIQIGQKLNIP